MSDAAEAAPTPVVPTTPDDLWDELVMHALASDGPIRDADVKEAVRYYRPKIEAELRRQAVERMQAMRLDYRTMPHAKFPIKWPDWRDYDEVLPSYCGCGDCSLWRSGS